MLTHFIVASDVNRHARTGGPLHADMTVLLLARGAKPHEDGAGTAAEAELLGHWLAAKIVSAWTVRAGLTETRAITGRIQRDRADLSKTGHSSPVGMLRPSSRADGAQAAGGSGPGRTGHGDGSGVGGSAHRDPRPGRAGRTELPGVMTRATYTLKWPL